MPSRSITIGSFLSHSFLTKIRLVHNDPPIGQVSFNVPDMQGMVIYSGRYAHYNECEVS